MARSVSSVSTGPSAVPTTIESNGMFRAISGPGRRYASRTRESIRVPCSGAVRPGALELPRGFARFLHQQRQDARRLSRETPLRPYLRDAHLQFSLRGELG